MTVRDIARFSAPYKGPVASLVFPENRLYSCGWKINGRSIQLSSYWRQPVPLSPGHPTQTILFVPTNKYYNNDDNAPPNLKAAVLRECGNRSSECTVCKIGD